ncbi:MAG: nuclear transport factor 2 family protein [Stellaceae bacterium]
MTNDTNPAATVEARLRAIEDRLAIYNLIASHPPGADTGAADHVAAVWTEDGVFDRSPQFAQPAGRAAIAAGSSTPEHRRALDEGIAHVSGLPYVRVTGDTAIAISYLLIVVPDRVGPVFDVPNHGASRGFHVHRVSANRWEFVRVGGEWKIMRRTLRPLDGTLPAREILRSALEP